MPAVYYKDRRRASVHSQTTLVPLILASSTPPPSSLPSRSTSRSLSELSEQSELSETMSRSNSGRSSKRDSFQRTSTDRMRTENGELDNAAGYRLYPITQSPKRTTRELKAMDSKMQIASPPTTTREHRRNKSSFDNSVRFATPELQDDSSDVLPEPTLESFQDIFNNPRPLSQFSARGPEDAPQTELPTPPDMPDSYVPESAYEYQRAIMAARRSQDSVTGPRSVSRSHFRDSTPVNGLQSPMSTKRNTAIRTKVSTTGFSSTGPISPGGDAVTPTTVNRSSADSILSQDTMATSIYTIPPLQSKEPDGINIENLNPVTSDDPNSFDLVVPPQEGETEGVYHLEHRAEQLFSDTHLRAILNDQKMLMKFTGFMNEHRPSRIPILIYYFDLIKALRAIAYSNEVAKSMQSNGHAFAKYELPETRNYALEEKAEQMLAVLVRDELPAYVAHQWIQIVRTSLQRRVTNTMAPHLRESSEGLGEVFCLTDPNRHDNPIIFASEEFARMTQYGMNHIIGRNPLGRNSAGKNGGFLYGSNTNPNSVQRMADACIAGREVTEVVLSYHRDGTPFLNLITVSPLMDTQGRILYYLGSHVDVSNMAKECTSLRGLAKIVQRDLDPEAAAEDDAQNKQGELERLAELFNQPEIEIVRRTGGRVHREYVPEDDGEAPPPPTGMRRIRLNCHSPDTLDQNEAENASTPIPPKVEGVYQHWLLIRPGPSFRILFCSPSLRVPGVPQSEFFSRIGMLRPGDTVRNELREALTEGRGSTAKVRWLAKTSEKGEGEGRIRWVHCTPLLGHNGSVGVWMVLLVDDEAQSTDTGRRFRAAPPVASNIGGKEWEARRYMQTPEPRLSGERRRDGAQSTDLTEGRRSSMAHSRAGSHIAGQMHHRYTPSVTGRHTPLADFSFNLDGNGSA